MIEKQELLKVLKDALKAEEDAILIYKRHLESAIFWTGIKQDKIKRAKELLDTLAQGSARHKKTVTKLIKDVQEKDGDAF
jgi:rubrerythrin